jgi:hypothetical protein
VCNESYWLGVICACATNSDGKLKRLLRQLIKGELPIAHDDRQLATSVTSRSTYAEHGSFITTTSALRRNKNK